jgi:hypothetical protein
MKKMKNTVNFRSFLCDGLVALFSAGMIISSFESVNVSAMAPEPEFEKRFEQGLAPTSQEMQAVEDACQSFANCLEGTRWTGLSIDDRRRSIELAMNGFFTALREGARLAAEQGEDTFRFKTGENSPVTIPCSGAIHLVRRSIVPLLMLSVPLSDGDYYQCFVVFALQCSLAGAMSKDDTSAVIDGFKFLLVEFLSRITN